MLPSILAKQAGYKNPLLQHQKYFPQALSMGLGMVQVIIVRAFGYGIFSTSLL